MVKDMTKGSPMKLILGFAILPVIIVYLCLSKFIVRGVTLGGVKG